MAVPSAKRSSEDESSSALISASDAAFMFSVSEPTLLRFAEVGYLQDHRDETGSVLYDKQQLELLFGKGRTPSTTSANKTSDPEAVTANVNTPKTSIVTPETIETEESEELEAAVDTRETTSGESRLDYSASVEEAVDKEEDKIAATESTEHVTKEEVPSLEVERLNHLVELQQQMIVQKEDEIKDLKDERNWLRSRIEKLEEKAERDQLLLLSDNQVITQLMQKQVGKSPVRAALEWFGVVKPEASDTIEVKR